MECLTSKYAAMKLLSFYIEIYFIGGYTQKIDLI